MFEVLVQYVLQKCLREFFEGISLRISFWKGEIVLKDLRLKALELIWGNLPVMIKAVFIDTITMQVPWKSLGRRTTIILIDNIFVLLEPAPDGYTLKERLADEDKEKLFESNLKKIQAPSERSWLDSLCNAIFGDLKVTINNVHIRYEDSISNPGHPFCSGLTLSKLVCVATDEQDNETFDASVALDKLRESLQMLRLAVYHDSESAPWMFGKSWDDLNSVDWMEIFQDGIDELDGNRTASLWTKDLRYLVFPINGALKYHPLGNLNSGNDLKKATVVLSDVYFTVSEPQYYWCIKLLEAVSTYMTRMEVSHLRPDVLVLEDTHAWWRYAMFAILQQKKICWFSWERIKHLCQLRRRYVQMYSTFLQCDILDIHAMQKIERILDSEVILHWRWLAHAKLESVGTMKRIWRSFGSYVVADAGVAPSVGETQNYSKKIN